MNLSSLLFFVLLDVSAYCFQNDVKDSKSFLQSSSSSSGNQLLSKGCPGCRAECFEECHNKGNTYSYCLQSCATRKSENGMENTNSGTEKDSDSTSTVTASASKSEIESSTNSESEQDKIVPTVKLIPPK